MKGCHFHIGPPFSTHYHQIMVETRSQILNKTLKKEEREEDTKPSLLLYGISKSKISKQGANHRNPVPMAEIKVEETESKYPLQDHVAKSVPRKKTVVTNELIQQLFGYIIDDGMSLSNASKKSGLGYSTVQRYYWRYLLDPNHKIPKPAPQFQQIKTYDEIKALIGYIQDDKLSIHRASLKANMTYGTGKKYYLKYLKSANQEIPKPASRRQRCIYGPQYEIPKNASKDTHIYTHDQIMALVDSMENEKMNILIQHLKKYNQVQ
jgi:transposase